MINEYTFRRSPAVLVQQMSEQTILLNPTDGQYFALDDIGRRVWELCDGSMTIPEMAELIHAEYSAPIDVIHTDVTDLITEFCNEKLVATS